MKENKILVACNSLDYILIQKTLENEFVLEKADVPDDVLRLRNANHYDLLLIDTAFLRADLKVIEGIKEERIPVVAMSSEPYDAKDIKLREAGCCACYIKPIRQELFVAFIRYWINEYQMK